MCTLDRPAEFLGLNSTLPPKYGAILQKILSIDHSNDFAHCQSCLADLWTYPLLFFASLSRLFFLHFPDHIYIHYYIYMRVGPDLVFLAGCRMFFKENAGCAPDAGYPATAGRIIRHAGYPAKWKIRPDDPALPDIRPNPNFYTRK